MKKKREKEREYRFHPKAMPELTRCARFESCLSNSPPSRFLQLQTSARKWRGKGDTEYKKWIEKEKKRKKREREGESVRGREMEKENRMEIRLGRYDEDNKSNHPAVSAHFAALSARSLPA